MTTGAKIAIGALVLTGLVVGGYFVFTTVVNKNGESTDNESTEGSLADVIEKARKKHEALGAWYDNLPALGKKGIQDGWMAMTEQQRNVIIEGLDKKPMTTEVDSFFKKLGFKG